MNAAAGHALAQQMFDAPRVYYETDAVPIGSRAGRDEICGSGTVTFVNPVHQSVRRDLSVKFNKRNSTARHGFVTIAGKRSAISADDEKHLFPVDVPPGTSTIQISVRTPGVRCESTPLDTLPRITIDLRTVTPGG
jgi:hypothetical protein